MAELIDSLASVLWRLKRIPAIEALLLQEEDSVEDRRADRSRERLEEILLTVQYLREGGHDLDEHDYYVVMGELHTWAHWPFDEGWDVEDPMVVGVVDQVDLADRLLCRRFATWDSAADHGRALADQIQEDLREPQLEFSIARAKRLIEMEMLSELNRPEAHLARERDRLLAQIRTDEARFRAGRRRGRGGGHLEPPPHYLGGVKRSVRRPPHMAAVKERRVITHEILGGRILVHDLGLNEPFAVQSG